jgi:hypothetical protein
MKKFGTPNGAAPGVANEKVGFAGVGTPFFVFGLGALGFGFGFGLLELLGPVGPLEPLLPVGPLGPEVPSCWLLEEPLLPFEPEP